MGEGSSDSFTLYPFYRFDVSHTTIISDRDTYHEHRYLFGLKEKSIQFIFEISKYQGSRTVRSFRCGFCKRYCLKI